MASAQIPVIDLAGAAGSPAEREAVAQQLVEAAIAHGFLYLRNAGREIPVAAVEETFSISRTLFALPTAEKELCAITTSNHGWLGERVETLDPKTQKAGDLKEAFNFAHFVNGHAQQPLPPSIAGSDAERHLAAFFDHCYRLCLTLNDLLGIGLQVQPPDFFTAAHRSASSDSSDSSDPSDLSGNTLRLLYYPPRRPGDDEPVRAGAHSDYGSLTLLFRLAGQAGLEILPEGDNAGWQPVPVNPPGTETDPAPPILVNIGDLLAYWTGGLLRSTVHRVSMPAYVPDETASNGPRYSIAFFCHPANNSPLTPVPSERVAAAVAAVAAARAKTGKPDEPQGQEAEKVLTAHEHLQMRLRATYLDLYKQ